MPFIPTIRQCIGITGSANCTAFEFFFDTQVTNKRVRHFLFNTIRNVVPLPTSELLT